MEKEQGEAEITREMIEAGADVLLCEFGGSATAHYWSAPDLAAKVYAAMNAIAPKDAHRARSRNRPRRAPRPGTT